MESSREVIKSVMTYCMEGEIKKVLVTTYLSLCYCFLASKIFHKNTVAQLVTFIPVICIFIILPLHLDSAYLIGTTSFFLTWLASFKLLMLAFNVGPLSNNHYNSFHQFLAIACFPIKIIQPSDSNEKIFKPSFYFNHNIFFHLCALLINVYDYRTNTHPILSMALFCFHIYFTLEMMLGIGAATARFLLEAELEPQFNKPHLSTSVQNFWGRRWNLAGTRILKPSVYVPVRQLLTVFIGRKWAMVPAVMTTFLVSGLIHELIYYYLGRVKPTWEVTWFFLLHGACVSIEIAVKRVMKGHWRLNRLVSTTMSIGFVMITGFWLFIPQLFRCNVPERAFAERAAFGEYMKETLNLIINNAAPSFK